MIVNYLATPKTRAPFCGLRCCGNAFGRCERSMYRHKSGKMNHKLQMRRYAKHVERNIIRKEIEAQIQEIQEITNDDLNIGTEPFDSDYDYYRDMYYDNNRLRGSAVESFFIG
jgi:hypothetical protein